MYEGMCFVLGVCVLCGGFLVLTKNSRKPITQILEISFSRIHSHGIKANAHQTAVIPIRAHDHRFLVEHTRLGQISGVSGVLHPMTTRTTNTTNAHMCECGVGGLKIKDFLCLTHTPKFERTSKERETPAAEVHPLLTTGLFLSPLSLGLSFV